ALHQIGVFTKYLFEGKVCLRIQIMLHRDKFLDVILHKNSISRTHLQKRDGEFFLSLEASINREEEINDKIQLFFFLAICILCCLI
ncbi:MAG: hypothetical protein WCQ55_03850, partial [Paludibacteraceae bacterium]